MNPSLVVVRRTGALTLLALLTHFGTLPAQTKPAPSPALQVSSLAGQSIAVLPLTYVVSSDSIRDAAMPPAHPRLVAWADSILAEEVLARAPEVTWIMGAELRRKLRSAPGMLPDPERLGQAALRSDRIKRLPDPLFGNLRTLVALSNGRLVLVPASVRFTTAPDSSVRAETIFVLADARSGMVMWRSTPVAVARTAAEALKATVDHIFPDAN